jgi:hypothetical protein
VKPVFGALNLQFVKSTNLAMEGNSLTFVLRILKQQKPILPVVVDRPTSLSCICTEL